MGRFTIRSVFAQLLATYVMVLAVTLAIGWAAVGYASRTVEKEIFNLNASILNLVRSELDTKVSQLKVLVSDIGTNYRVTAFSYVKKPLSSENRLLLFNMIKDFDVFLTKYGFINEFYLYFRGPDLIVTSTGAFEPRLFYDYFFSGKGTDFDRWYELVRRVNRRGEISTDGSGLNIKPVYDCLVYRQTVVSSDDPANYVNAFAFVDKEMIKGIIDKAVWNEESGIFIIDGENRIVTSNKEADLLPGLQQGPGRTWSRFRIGDDVYASSTAESALFGWRYVFVVPLSLLMKELGNFRSLLVAAFWLILAFGILLSVVLSYRNSLPVRRLLGIVRAAVDQGPQGAGGAEKTENEYAYIARTVEKSLEKLSEIHTQFERQQSELKDSFLGNLIVGQFSDQSLVRRTLDYYGVAFPHPFFTVAVYRSDAEGAAEDGMAIESDKLLGSFPASEFQCFMVRKGERERLILINSAAPPEKRAVLELFGALNDVFEESGVSGIFAVGGPQDAPEKIGLSYNQALRCLDYHFLNAADHVVFFADVEAATEPYYYPDTAEEALVNQVGLGNAAETKNLVSGLFRENLAVRKVAPEMIQIFLLNLQNTIYKIEDQRRRSGDPVRASSSVDFTRMMDAPGAIGNIREKFLEAFEALCARRPDEAVRPLGTQRVRNVVEYIDSHYAEYDLSLSSLADRFSVTMQHLSTAFKAQVGENVLFYIHRVRVERAKELLISTGLTNERIGKEVGFGSSLSFVRTFRKLEGVSPAEYRKIKAKRGAS